MNILLYFNTCYRILVHFIGRLFGGLKSLDHWYPCSGDVSFGFQIQSGRIIHTWWTHVCYKFPIVSLLVWHLLNSWWPVWQSSHSLPIPASKHWLGSQTRQADALPTELDQLDIIPNCGLFCWIQVYSIGESKGSAGNISFISSLFSKFYKKKILLVCTPPITRGFNILDFSTSTTTFRN